MYNQSSFSTIAEVNSWRSVCFRFSQSALYMDWLECFFLGVPFVLRGGKLRIIKTLTQITGIISTGFGFYYMYNIGVTEGLFKLWAQG
jgi:hypothetical protein